MSEQGYIATESDSADRDVLVFRIGSTWCACDPGLICGVHRVEPRLLAEVSDNGRCIVLGSGQSIELCPGPTSMGNPLDSPTVAQRWIIFDHNGARHGVQVDEVVGITRYEVDDDGQAMLRVQDEQGASHTLVLRMDMPGALLESAA